MRSLAPASGLRRCLMGCRALVATPCRQGIPTLGRRCDISYQVPCVPACRIRLPDTDVDVCLSLYSVHCIFKASLTAFGQMTRGETLAALRCNLGVPEINLFNRRSQLRFPVY